MAERTAERQKLYSLLGDLPPRERGVTAETIKETEYESYLVETLVLDLNGLEPVPAYFVKPKKITGKLPAVLYNHAHGGEYEIGKEELLAGRKFLQRPVYAAELAGRGYAVLCIDAWAFGERRGRTESEIFKGMLWSGQVLWGMMVYDSLKAVDYLTLRPEVDGGRIGTVGISMGGIMAWWLAALDERIRVCVDLCALIDFQTLIESRGLDRHGVYSYVPGLLKHFSTASINGLIAPRPHLSLAGQADLQTPAAGVAKIDREMRTVYQNYQRPEAWQVRSYSHSGHYETAAMRREVLAFFGQWL
jgi:dienelactone hydrolase